MKFRNPKTGEVFEHKGIAFCGPYKSDATCEDCPIAQTPHFANQCNDWILANPERAAELMGYELLNDDGQPVQREKNIPGPEYDPADVAFHREPDMVNHPPHYTQGGIECIDALTAMISPYKDPNDAALSWQVVKYLWRHPFKGKPLEDLKKARYYLERLIEGYEKGAINHGG